MKLNITIVGEGEPLLLMHGFGFNQRCFSSIVNVLSKSYQCILVDLPGFGLSPYSPYSLNDLLSYLHLILPARINILGWSLGGTIALAYTKRYSNDVKNLILVSTNPAFIAQKNWPGMPLNEFKEFLNLIETDLSKAMITFLALQFPKHSMDKKLFLKLKQLANNIYLTKQAALNALNILCEQDLRQDFKNINIPNLNILGKHDQLVPIQCAKNLEFLNMNNNIYICETSAHIPFISQEALFIKLVTQFLELNIDGS